MPAPVFVLTCDQHGSRRSPDAVPGALDALATFSPAGHDETRTPLLAPERTAGDEIQCAYSEPAGVVCAVEALTRLGGWRIGVGIGEVDHPLPESTRAARGPAFVAAREAVERARVNAGQLAVRRADEGPTVSSAAPATSPFAAGRSVVGGPDYRLLHPADAAEHALTLLVATLVRRTTAGWEIVELMDEGLKGRQAAERLGISESAVSQRLTRAAHEEGVRARALSVFLLDRAAEEAS